jgi:hypothetical protein
MRDGQGGFMNANGLKTALLLGGLTGILLLIGYAFGGEAGLVMGFGLAAVMNIGAYWFSDRIALRMAGAREVSEQQAPQIHALVEEVARASGLPKPRVAIIESDAPNAFATGRDPRNALVAVTTGILRRSGGARLCPREAGDVFAPGAPAGQPGGLSPLHRRSPHRCLASKALSHASADRGAGDAAPANGGARPAGRVALITRGPSVPRAPGAEGRSRRSEPEVRNP